MANKRSKKFGGGAVHRKIRNKMKSSKNPHKSFRRTYREDCRRELEVPGIMQHLAETFKILFKNWKLFVPLLTLAMVLNVLFVGLMNQATYAQLQETINQTNAKIAGGEVGGVGKAVLILVSTITTGGLAGGSSGVSMIFGVMIFLLLWLTTIFLIRHKMAGNEVKLRDGLYNAMTPLVSTLVVMTVAVVQCVPILLLIIAYSAAMQTGFLVTPFYALVFFVFAVAMIVLSGYLLSSTLMALVAVTVPGLYPVNAMRIAADLMVGRRIKMILRLVALALALVVMWAIVMLPIIMFDMAMKNFEWAEGIPFVPVCLNIMSCFTVIYVTVYLYLYYRWMIDYKD